MQRIKATLLVVFLTVSVSTAGATAIVGTDTQVAESSPKEIDSCTTINESGRYVLSEDISMEDLEIIDPGVVACIHVTASDVVIDGQGHTILGDMVREPAINVSAGGARLSNVSVENLGITEMYGNPAIRYEGVDGGSVSNVTITGSTGVLLTDSSEIAVRDSDIDGLYSFAPTNDIIGYGVSVTSTTTDTVIAGNTFTGVYTGAAVNLHGAVNTTIANNQIRGCAECLQGDYGIDPDVPADDSGAVSIAWSAGTAVVNNTIEQHAGAIYLNHGGLTGYTQETVIANNTLKDNHMGITLGVTQRPVTIQHNDVADNDFGIYTPAIENCVWDAAGIENVQIHRNDIVNNSAYGVLNERSFTLNATQNYWGAESGPGSANDTDAPFEDPVTGTLADGAGNVVSEDPGEPGVSNVHFDSWLNESVTNSSAESAA